MGEKIEDIAKCWYAVIYGKRGAIAGSQARPVPSIELLYPS